MVRVKLLLFTCSILTALFVAKPVFAAFELDVPVSNVSAIDRGIRLYIMEKSVQKVYNIYSALQKTAKICQNDFNLIKTECEKCEEGCEGKTSVKVITISKASILLIYEMIKSLTVEAPHSLNEFGNKSFIYIKHITAIAQLLGSSLVKENDPSLKSRGKGLLQIVKQLKESARRLLTYSGNRFGPAVKSVQAVVKDLKDESKALMQTITDLFNKIDKKFSRTEFKDLDKNIVRLSRKIDVSVQKDRATQHSHVDRRDLPAIHLPEVHIPPVLHLPRIDLPRIRTRGWWGKRRRRSSFDCNCPFCDLIRSIETENGKIRKVCGESYLKKQEQSKEKMNDLAKLNSYVMKNVVLSKITLDSGHLLPNGLQVDKRKATMTLVTPGGIKIKMKMQRRIPTTNTTVSLSEADVVKIVRVEAPRVYSALLRHTS